MHTNTTLCAELKTTKPTSLRLVGITGGIGTGKSAVSDILRSMGYVVMSSDDIAKDIMEQDDVRAELRSAFGNDIFQDDGTYHRPAIARLIFGNHDRAQEYRERINGITHPRVIREMYRRAIEQYHRGQTLIFNESALLFETGLYTCYDSIVTVTAPLPLRYERLRLRGMADDDITLRIAQQLPDEEKQSRSSMVIDNSASLERLHHQVQEMLAGIQ